MARGEVGTGNEPVGQREFDQYQRFTDHRLDELEQWRKDHERLHRTEQEQRAKAQKQKREDAKKDRQWSRAQLAAWAAVAAVLIAAWMTSMGK
jgi:hypothetical protein